ncbi:hypothetical protein TSUD_09440 [Trifolium subterraneum]|nr:hypothetical protein TSUD_09440 [Trifolium subterraneum]
MVLLKRRPVRLIVEGCYVTQMVDGLFGFAKNLGNTNAYLAELWGFYEGLRLANQMGVHQLEVQLDSSIVVDSIQHGKTGSAKAWSIIRRIKQLLAFNWNVRINHTYWEANRCADVLANMRCIAQHSLHVFDIPPPKVVSVLDNDLRVKRTIVRSPATAFGRGLESLDAITDSEPD